MILCIYMAKTKHDDQSHFCPKELQFEKYFFGPSFMPLRGPWPEIAPLVVCEKKC